MVCLAEKGKLIGEITHYFSKISVAVIKLKGALKEGDEIQVKGATTDFKQKAKSMQIEHKTIKSAKKGESVGLKVKDKVRNGDSVYKL